MRLLNFATDAFSSSDERFFSLLLNGLGTDSFPQDGTLLLTWNLVPGITYNFESQASVAMNASAEPVPEPASLILLGSGILGLARCKEKNFRYDQHLLQGDSAYGHQTFEETVYQRGSGIGAGLALPLKFGVRSAHAFYQSPGLEKYLNILRERRSRA